MFVNRVLGLASLLLMSGAAACSSRPDPAKTAESLTRTVYANDLAGTAANFDPQTQSTITRADLGRASDLLHSYGDYRSLSQLSGNANTGQYTYLATFGHGTATVLLRLDTDGQVGAFRIRPAPGV